jgi:hypothetical protein
VDAGHASPAEISHIAYRIFVEDKKYMHSPCYQEQVEEVACHVLYIFVKKHHPGLHSKYDASLVADFILQETPNIELCRIISLYCQRQACTKTRARNTVFKELDYKVKAAACALEEHDAQLRQRV